MNPTVLLRGDTAVRLYGQVKDLPIYDYHCHLSPKEIWEDRPASDLTSLWLSGDHYKWRLMRQSGIEERLITGDAPPKEKLRAYAAALSTAAGNPLYLWTQMELSRYFGIEELLTQENAEKIYDQANKIIHSQRLSPRKLIAMSGVKVIATTDDPADSLIWHEKLAADPTLPCRVIPSFRPDRLLLIRAKDYQSYLKKLEAICGFPIDSYHALMEAAELRLNAFVRLGCRCTDLGIPVFPSAIGSEAEAETAFASVLEGQLLSDSAFNAFLGRAMTDLGRLYAKHGLLMQLHMAVLRNVNIPLYEALGADAGGDCMGDPIPAAHLANLLNTIHKAGGLPPTVLYTLNPAMTPLLCTVAGSFPGVVCGAAWWFCDHARGIEEVLRAVAETGQLGSFYGMLTDSRSFLSYTRHDYFRRILCSFLGELIDKGEFAECQALPLAEKLCCGNIAALLDNFHINSKTVYAASPIPRLRVTPAAEWRLLCHRR